MLEVQNLEKKFQNVAAVDNISFSVKPGKIFGLLGPNGAGKTTTIRTILNIIKPTGGRITLNGQPIRKDFFNDIGYLPEERGLYKKSKVIDVINYLANLKNLDPKKIKDESALWLEKLGIENYRDKKIEELSKGNQQKIQFICAVIHDPEVLILDEPFSGFDPINQQQIKDLILDFVGSGKIIVLSTHQMETAEKLCSEIFLINKGKEVLSGELSAIKKNFGGNHIKIGSDGDLKFLNTFKEVLNFEQYSNFAEVHLKDDVKASEFLKTLVQKMPVTHYSIIEPTLNKIFIDTIKKSA